MPATHIWIFGSLVLLVFSNAHNWAVDLLFTPWARARPPLLAAWSGRLTTGNGHGLAVVMNLHRGTYNDGTVCVRCSQIEGTAVTCDAAGVVRRYDVSGSSRDRHARRLHIGASSDTTPPPQGLELSTLSGAWDRPNTLTLEADFVWRREAASVSASDDPATQPVPLVMRRMAADDLTAACTRQWR